MNSKYHEALCHIRHYIDDVSSISHDELMYECSVLQELVDKSTPKHSYTSEDNFSICPICKEHLYWDGKEKVTYCCHCGQAIDWSE